MTGFKRRVSKYKEPYQAELFLNNIFEDIIKEIDNNLELYSQNKTYKKYLLYSGHDYQIEALLAYFGHYSNECAY